MQFRFISIISLLFWLPCCFNNTQSNGERKTYLVQALINSSLLASIKETIAPLIEEIIKEELKLPKDYDFNFFLPKTRLPHPLTLYYLNDLQVTAISTLDSSLKNVVTAISHPENIAITNEVHFFGDQKDELVIMINDPHQELTEINKWFKKEFNQQNQMYKQINHANLYDVTNSEQYSYNPHIGLGRIRINSIRNQLKSRADATEIIERIKKQIILASTQSIKKLSISSSQKISFDRICLFDIEKKECITEYTLR